MVIFEQAKYLLLNILSPFLKNIPQILKIDSLFSIKFLVVKTPAVFLPWNDCTYVLKAALDLGPYYYVNVTSPIIIHLYYQNYA